MFCGDVFLLTTLTLPQHRVRSSGVNRGAPTVAGAVAHVDGPCALAPVHLDHPGLRVNLTNAAKSTGFAASVGVCRLRSRLTVQRVEGGASLGRLRRLKLIVHFLTGILHTFVIGNKRLIGLDGDGRVIDVENTVSLDTAAAALSGDFLIFITLRAVFVADHRFADDDVQGGIGVHVGAAVTVLTGARGLCGHGSGGVKGGGERLLERRFCGR